MRATSDSAGSADALETFQTRFVGPNQWPTLSDPTVSSLYADKTFQIGGGNKFHNSFYYLRIQASHPHDGKETSN